MIQKHARKTDSESSHLAAIENESRRGTQARMVFQAVVDYPNSTSRELSVRSGLERYMVARRLSDAEDLGLVQRGIQRKCCYSKRLALTWSAC